MPKDYAKYPYRSRRTLIEGWGWRLLVVIILLTIMGFGIYSVYFYKRLGLSQSINGWMMQAKAVLHHKNSSEVVSTAQPPKHISDTTSPEVHFDFYTELPNMKMKISEKNRVNSPQIIKDNSEKYVVQLGLYKSEAAAKAHRISLILQGVDVNLVKTQMGYFQLQHGLYQTLRTAKAEQLALKKKGIESVVINQGRS